MTTITSSLVLFHNDPAQFGRAISSFIDGCDGVLHVVDNSSSALQHDLFRHPRVRYDFAGSNLGFGVAHNRAVAQSHSGSEFHLFLNPDVMFDPGVLAELVVFMRGNPSVGAVMPRVTYPDGAPQHLCKLLPTPFDLILRRFIPLAGVREKLNQTYELHALPLDRASDVPVLSGCFLLVRTSIIRQIGGFDPRFFMYMEDVDLVRRIGDVARTVFLPSVSIQHVYAKGSYRNPRLLSYHLRSAISYFFKWGWFFDRVRKDRNRAIIKALSRS